MLMILSFFSFMHIQIKCEVTRWLSALRFLKAVFIFTHQNTENIGSNELFLPPKNKDPSCHSEQRVLHSCLPTV